MYNDFNSLVYRLVKDEAKVLDVGCATSRLMEKLKNEKECYVVGIERCREMARITQDKCDKLIIDDIENLSALPFSQNFFDVIIFENILEHLKNPEKVLKFFYDYLFDDGYILISVPNVAFITVRVNLLFGKFNYSTHRLLDRTHLHLYTLESAKELIESCGYKVRYVGSYNPVRKRYYYFLKIATSFSRSLFTIDFIFKATKKVVK